MVAAAELGAVVIVAGAAEATREAAAITAIEAAVVIVAGAAEATRGAVVVVELVVEAAVVIAAEAVAIVEPPFAAAALC
jgi:hypothetical protein